ncbi:TPA: 2-hydroxycarboxylate transporter family protein [Salmonella enterica]|uniref:Citrate-sodium symporter n=1 Tax=Salmonella enterica TaxID=28901 RepID=A0A744CD32_SALER|nr:2-hydroxycarboxylate transporter family protein [Salmonella enterica]HAF4919987.1 2-hydroxycarboxylate transporter family protein [Salmonella enterica]
MRQTGQTARPLPAPTADPAWLRVWLKCMDIQIGIVPLPVFLALLVVIAVMALKGKVPSDLSMSIGVLAVGGFIFMELGKRIRFISVTGVAAIMAFVVPSALTFYGVIPPAVVESVRIFTKVSNFLYLYIAIIIVGSIMSMPREVLVAGFLKIFVPLAAGSVVAALVGTGVGMAMGLDWIHSLFFIVIPIMAGGLGEGAIPLSLGYSMLMALPQDVLFARIIPVVMLGSFTAVILSGLLNLLGKRYPSLTGEGRLQSGPDATTAHTAGASAEQVPSGFEPLALGTSLVTVTGLYLLGTLGQKLYDFPAVISMLLMVVVMKLLRMIPEKMETAGRNLYSFTSGVVTYPLLFTMGVALTPWDKFVSAFTLPTLVTVFATVFAMIATGFLVARKLRMYPIDVAVVNACHSGQGGTGDIAILTAANRMALMPFAQISTRIGGAITVTLALIAIRHVV